MCFFVQTNHTRKELLFLMFKEINLRNHSSLHKLFYSLDILFLDQQNTPAFMECKTFGSPTALKKYITEIDKMYSLRYLINDNASYGHIAFFINYLRTPHTDNLRYKDTSGKLINLNIHFKYIDRAYGLFVSNLFFPISLVKLWRKYKLHFIYYRRL